MFKMMRDIYNEQIANSVLKIIMSNESKYYVSFHDLLKGLLQNFNLDITEDFKTDVISISGDNGFHVIATLYYVLKELEHNRIIRMIKNNNGSQYHYNITNNKMGNPQYTHITGELNFFLEDNKQTNIWLSPDIDWFIKHGYKSKEHVEAEKQTHYALCTMMFAVLTFMVNVVSDIQLKECYTCVIICSLIVLVIGIILVIRGYKWEFG